MDQQDEWDGTGLMRGAR